MAGEPLADCTPLCLLLLACRCDVSQSRLLPHGASGGGRQQGPGAPLTRPRHLGPHRKRAAGALPPPWSAWAPGAASAQKSVFPPPSVSWQKHFSRNQGPGASEAHLLLWNAFLCAWGPQLSTLFPSDSPRADGVTSPSSRQPQQRGAASRWTASGPAGDMGQTHFLFPGKGLKEAQQNAPSLPLPQDTSFWKT